MIENARSFGWKGISEAFSAGSALEQAIQVVPARNRAELHAVGSSGTNAFGRLHREIGNILRIPRPRSRPSASCIKEVRDILVMDRLNTIQGDKAELFDRLMSLVSSGHKIIILIIDSATHIGPESQNCRGYCNSS